MGVLAFFVSVLVIPGLPGAAIAPRWCLLAVVVPFVWYFSASRVTVGHVLGFAFLLCCAVTLIWAPDLDLGLYALAKFSLFGLVFCIGASRQSLNAVWIGAGFGAALNSAAATAQYFTGWDTLPQAVVPAGTFFNKNSCAEFCALVLIGLLGVPKWRWLAVGTVPAVVLCQSRTVFVALAAVFVIWIFRRSRVAAALAVLAAIVGVIYVWNTGYTLPQRIDLWRDTIAGMGLFGRGIGSFWPLFPEFATRIDPLTSRPSEAHNDLLQLFYEVGPASLLAVALVAVALRPPFTPVHYVLVVFLVEGMAGFPLYLPGTAFLAALVLGHLCGRWAKLCRAAVWSGTGPLHGLAFERHAADHHVLAPRR